MLNEQRAVREAGGGPCRVQQQRRQQDQECRRQHAGAARTGAHHRGQVCCALYGRAGLSSAVARRACRKGEMSRKACGLTDFVCGWNEADDDERRLRQTQLYN